MPRATLFTPKPKEQLDKNPLWQEVFNRQDSDEEEEDDSDQEQEIFNMYKDTLLSKGIKTAQARPSGTGLMNLTSSALKQKQDLVLPPIKPNR